MWKMRCVIKGTIIEHNLKEENTLDFSASFPCNSPQDKIVPCKVVWPRRRVETTTAGSMSARRSIHCGCLRICRKTSDHIAAARTAPSGRNMHPAISTAQNATESATGRYPLYRSNGEILLDLRKYASKYVGFGLHCKRKISFERGRDASYKS